MNYASEPDAAYIVGRIVGIFLFPLLVYGIGYWMVRIIKKRKPNAKEKKTILFVAIAVAVFGILGQVARSVNENF